MSIRSIPAKANVTATDLAARLAAGERVSVLDVRDDPAGGIEAPSAGQLHLPADRAIAEASRLADEVAEPTIVVCARGKTAQPVADELRRRGVDAAVLEGGLRAWLGVLRTLAVDVGVPGLDVRQIQRPGRGCLSYVLAAHGQAVVVDPAPDVSHYLELADELGARIVHVVDTHLHADHLSGARRLAELSGATLWLPEATLERGVAFADATTPLRDGDVLALGPIELTAVSLPGHTTDMTGLLVADRALISGDSLFADGIARPDLQRGDSEGAAKMARTLHATLRERILSLDDATLILPGHTHPGVLAEPVAPTLAEVRATVGELSIDDAQEFASAIVADLPPRPANYESVIAANAGREAADPELEQGGNSCATSGPKAEAV